MSLQITKTFNIDTDPDSLFEKLTTEFTEVADWASGIDSSGPDPKYQPVADGVPGGRVCQVPGLGRVDEQLVRYEPESHTFAFTVNAKKIPSFVSDLKNTYSLRPVGQATAVTMNLTAEVSGPLGAIMKPMMRRKFDKALEAIGGDLASIVESGKVSDRKAKELAQAGR
jgi:hypothetical protein